MIRNAVKEILLTWVLLLAASAGMAQNPWQQSAEWWEQSLRFELPADYQCPVESLPGGHDKSPLSPDYAHKLEERCLSFAKVQASIGHLASRLSPEEGDFLEQYSFLSLYLSDFLPVHTAATDRKGLWQLNFATARRYGLQINGQQDQRLDPIRSTRAAHGWMQSLRSRYDSTDALLAFVHGPLFLSQKASASHDSIASHTLSQLKELWQVQEEWKEEAPNSRPGFATKTVESQKAVLLDDLLSAEGIDASLWESLNPAITGPQLAAGSSITLPEGTPTPDWQALNKQAEEEESRFAHFLDSARTALKKGTPDPRNYETISYKVRAGDVLGTIARRMGVAIRDIQKWNKLRGSTIYVGQRLTIYRKKGLAPPPAEEKEEKPASTVASTSSKPTPPQAEPLQEGDYFLYEVQRGDTLWDIARQFEGISDQDIMRWNGIDTRIDVGQQLKIKKGGSGK